jgi:hypothetical protein
MVVGIFYILYAGITKTYNIWLYISLGLLAVESVVYLGNGQKCPFTDLAKKYGDEKGYVGDVFLPKKVADNTFYFFGTLLLIGIVVLILNYFGLR